MNTAEARKITSTKQLAKAFQTHFLPVGEWVLATTWAWNFEREAMGYAAHLYKADAEGMTHMISSAEDHEDFTTEAEAGAWAMSMMLAY